MFHVKRTKMLKGRIINEAFVCLAEKPQFETHLRFT